MTTSMRSLALVCLVVSGAVSQEMATATATESVNPDSVPVIVPTRGGGNCVYLELPAARLLVADSRLAEAYIEFSLPGLPGNQIAEVTGYAIRSQPAMAVNLEALTPFARWEITPMDHDRGLGSYIRLYLPKTYFGFVGSDGKLRVLIHAPAISASDVVDGVGSASLEVRGLLEVAK